MCGPTFQNKTTFQNNQINENERKDKELLKQPEAKQEVLLQNKMTEEQQFKTYKEDKDAYQKKWPLSSRHKLDTEIFDNIKEDLKFLSSRMTEGDMNMVDYLKKQINDTGIILSETDKYQKSKGYKSVGGRKEMMPKGFNFSKYVLSKEQIAAINNVKENDKESINAAVKAVDTAIANCHKIKTKARQMASDENFEDFKMSEKQKKEIENLKSIWDVLGDFDSEIGVVDQNVLKAIFERKKVNRYPDVEVTFTKDKQKQTMTFDWDKEKIIRGCMVKGPEKNLRSMENTGELKAFTDDMTEAISKIIAEFLSVKYNIDPLGSAYEKLLINLISTRYFDEKNSAIDVANLEIRSADNKPLAKLEFSELFNLDHKLLKDLLNLRNYSEKVLETEEEEAFQNAGKARVDSLADPMAATRINVKNSLIFFCEQVAKRLDEQASRMKDVKGYEPRLEVYNNLKNQIITAYKYDLEGGSVNDTTLTKILSGCKNLEYNDVKNLGKYCKTALGVMFDFSKHSDNYSEEGKNDYEALKCVGDTCDIIADMVNVTIETNSDKETDRTRTTHINISDEAIRKLKNSSDSLENYIKKNAENICRLKYREHPEYPELKDYAEGKKKIDVWNFLEKSLDSTYTFIAGELQSNDIGATLLTSFYEVRKAIDAANTYCNELTEIINKKEDVKEYYTNIEQVEENLYNVKYNLEFHTYLDPVMYQRYQKADEFKVEFEKLRAGTTASELGQASEQEKIEAGRKIYKLLERFEQFKNELAEDKDMREIPRGKKLIEKTVLIQESEVDRLIDEKKEELAFYEGNLLKIKINNFKTENGKTIETIKNLRKQSENGFSKESEDLLKKYVEKYNSLRADMDVYLKRYAELENYSYYVKQVAAVRESMTRQVRSIDNEKLFNCYEELVKTEEYSNSIHKGAYSDEDKLAEKYKSFMDKLTGREKFGSFENHEKIDGNKVDENLKMDFTDQEIEEGLNSVLDIALVSTRMKKAGLNSYEILRKMNYPADIMQDINERRGSGSDTLISMVRTKPAARKWFEEKAEQFVKYYETVRKITYDKVKKNFEDKGWDEELDDSIKAEYIVNQTQVGVQVKVLQQLGYAMGLTGACKKLYDIYIDNTNSSAELELGFEEENKDILHEEGLNAYRELKSQNNRQVIYQKETQAILERLNAFKDELGNNNLNFEADYNKLMEVEKLRSSNSKEFDAVKKAAVEVNRVSEDMKTFVTQIESYSQQAAKDKIKAIDVAYTNLLNATQEYITTRSVFYRAFTTKGQQRLDAIKEIHAHALAQKKAYGSLNAPMVSYKKDETIDVSDLANRLQEFKEKKKDMFYDAFIEFKDQFKDMLAFDGSEDTLDSTAGVNLFIDLKKEELLLQKQAANEIIAVAEKIKIECTKTDAKANKTTMYSKWIRCADFYEKYKNSCPEDAKKAVESIRVLANDYLNGREAEGVVTNLKDEKRTLHDLAHKIQNKVKLKQEEINQLMWLRFRYEPFVQGVKQFKSEYRKNPEFIKDYETLIEDFTSIKDQISIYTNTKENPTQFRKILKSAQKKMDEGLTYTREQITKYAYVTTEMKGEAGVAIKNTLEEIKYFFSLYLIDKEKSGISEEEIKYYTAQKTNLEDLLTSNIARMLVEEDYGAVYKKKKSTEKIEAGYTTSLKNIVPVDKRMEDYRAYMNKTAEEKAGEKITEEKQVSRTLRYIVEVEAEKAQLQGVKTLYKTSPYMAKELEKQLEVRTQFEKQLGGLNKGKDKEKIATLMKAMVNTAGDYYKILHDKETKILNQKMSPEQEGMLYYFTSFSKYYDEAKIYVTMLKKWTHTLGIKLSGSNHQKLADIVGRIDFKAKETIYYNHFTDANTNAKNKVGNLKNEATLAAYATQEVCKERDNDFVSTMQNLREVKLNSVKSFRINDVVKEGRKFGGDEKYDSLKVDKSKNFTLFGFTLWGKVDYSLDDFITRLSKYSIEYKELEEPLKDLVMLSGYASSAVLGLDSKTQDEATKTFTQMLRDINLKMLKSTSNMVSKRYEEGHRRSDYRHQADARYVMKGWTEFYQIFKELGKQLDDYVDRNPRDEKAVLNSKAKSKHDSFVANMADIGKGGTYVEKQEQRFFAVMRVINENQYAESAYEHSCNVEYTMYRDYLMSWFENHCYKEAQSALRAIQMANTDLETLSKQYDGFLNILEKYAASKAISRETHDYLKEYVFNACKQKNKNMKDKSVEELAKIRGKIVYDNIIAEFNLGFAAGLTPELREHMVKKGLYDPTTNKLASNNLAYIQKIAIDYAKLEIRGVKADKAFTTSVETLNDAAEFVEGARKVLYNEGGWWFILKDYLNYGIAEIQSAYFKAKNA